MIYREDSIKRSDCGTTFTFTPGEQGIRAVRGCTDEPKRCHSRCAVRKAQDGDEENRSLESGLPL